MIGPLLVGPILRDDNSPPLSGTFAAISSMIVAAFEANGGDVAEGKLDFADLKNGVDCALAAPQR